MPIDYQTVCAFVRAKGKVSLVDPAGIVKLVFPGVWPDAVELCEKAEKFSFDETWYSREEFEKVLDSWKAENPSS